MKSETAEPSDVQATVEGTRPPSRLEVDVPEASMLQDIDMILSRLETGIARERKAMDELLERIRRPAA